MSEGEATDPSTKPSEVPTPPVRVLIADDQPLFRRGLWVVLGTDDRIEVVAEAENGEEAIARAVELVPDVILMDVRMPRLNGIEAARVISQQVPTTKIIMLTVSDEEDDLYEAIKAGATGYLLKEISVEQVAEAIQAVVQGHSLITPSMASKLLTEFQKLSTRTEGAAQLASPTLTPRELEVLKLVAEGHSSDEIAELLVISRKTVHRHRANILEKLGMRHRVDLTRYAIRRGLVEP